MGGRQTGDQSQLFYLFNLEKRFPARHLLRWTNPIVTRVLADLREQQGRSTVRPADLRSTPNSCYGCSSLANVTAPASSASCARRSNFTSPIVGSVASLST